jgi:hypothetical protein
MNTSFALSPWSPIVADAIDEPNTLTVLIGTDQSGNKAASASKFFRADGSKVSRAPAHWRALQLHIPDVGAMRSILAIVGSFPQAALCNARFAGLPIYGIESLDRARNQGMMQLMREYGFRIWPQERMIKTFGKASGVHRDDNGPVVARISQNLQPTSWLFIDQDIESGAPKWAFDRDILEILESHVPGIRSSPRVTSPSASARVSREGIPVGGGHGHIWVHTNPVTTEELKRASQKIRGCLIVANECWTAPDKNGRPQVRLPIDLSGWSLGRMVYAGKPEVEVGSGLTVKAPALKVFEGEPVDLRAGLEPDREALIMAQRALRPGSAVSLSKGDRLSIDIYDLSTGTDVELEDGSLTTLREVHDELLARWESGELSPKIRMQSPLRPESRSVAAFAALSRNNEVFIIDSGLPGETHWIKERPEDIFTSLQNITDRTISLSGIESSHASSEAVTHPLLRFFDLRKPPALPNWVIPGFIAEGLVVIAGAHGVGKTSAILPLSLVAAGIHRKDDPLSPRHWRHVIYITEDLNQAHRIIRCLAEYDTDLMNVDTISDRLHLVESIRMPVHRVIQVGHDYHERFTRVIDEVELKPLVVIDTKSSLIELEDENDNAAASEIVAALKQQFKGLPTWVIGHIAKASLGRTDVDRLSMRGSSSFEADANQVLYLIKENNTRYLVRGKTRFEAAWPELQIKSLTAELIEEDVWGDLQSVTLRWSQLLPSTTSRAQHSADARQADKAAAAEDLRSRVLSAVVEGQASGNHMNSTMLREKLGGRSADVDTARKELLACGAIVEENIPRAERSHPARKTRLVIGKEVLLE